MPARSTKSTLVSLTLLAITLGYSACTKSSNQRDFTPDKFYLHELESIRLNALGLKKARATWDSIRPLLCKEGSIYCGISQDNTPIKAWLSFAYDSSKQAKGPHRLTFQVLIKHPHKVPNGYIYVGDRMMTCIDEFDNQGDYSLYSDTLSAITESCLSGFIQRQGIRFDTNRGPVETLSETQAQMLDLTLKGYKALSILSNELNKTTTD